MKKILLLFFTTIVCAVTTMAQPMFFNNNVGTVANAIPFHPNTQPTWQKSQIIYGPGVFTGAMVGLIDTIWVRPNASFPTGMGPYTNLEISFAQSIGTATGHANNTYQTGLTSALVAPSFTTGPMTGPVGSNGWVPYALTTPYLYNPALSLLMEFKSTGSTNTTFCYRNPTTIANSALWGPNNTATTGTLAGTIQIDLGLSMSPPLNCATPSAGNATYIGTDSVTLAWTENNTPTAATTWQIEWGPSGFTPTGNPQITTTTNPHGIGGLTQNTSYDFYVRAYCGPNDSSYYHQILNVTTLATCPWPTNLNATGVTATQATLTWVENGTSTNWQVLIGLQGTLGTPTLSTPPSFPVSGSPTFTLPGLPDNTCFDYYVRSDCGTDTSVWTGPYTFCTLIAPLNCTQGNPSIVFYEGFDAATASQTSAAINVTPQAGWTRNGPSSTTSMNWRLDNNAGNSSGTGALSGHTVSNTNPGYAMLETSSGPGFDTLFSPSIDLSGVTGAARVKFFYYKYGANNGELQFLVKHATGVDSLWSIAGQTHTTGSLPWDSVVINLNAYIGQSVQLCWRGTNTIGCCSGDMSVDEIEVEGCVACAAVSNINVDTASATSATISWTDNNTPTSTRWFLEVVPAGMSPTGTPTDTSLTNPAVITGLSPFTAYDVYVRPDCDTNGIGGWAGPVTFVACSPLAGTYTVDPGLPAGGTNFQTLNAVAVALDCGISAPVVFDMAAGASFNEQVIFDEVMGASATNTITFNGNGDTVFFAATVSADRHTIRLEDADYFNFNNVVVQATGTGFGFAMHLYSNAGNGTDHNNFSNCTFTCPTTTTSSAFAAFLAGGSLTSYFTQTAAAADSNMVDSCTTIGGYGGITFYGQFSTFQSSGNVVTNNNVEEIALYGIYMYGQDDGLVSRNEVSRQTRTSVTTFYGVAANGISNRMLFEKNYVHTPFGGNTSSTNLFRGLYTFADASSAANSNRWQNNIIENVASNGTQEAIYMSTANNIEVFHNTVVLDGSGTGTTRGIAQFGTASQGQNIQNNNIVISRPGTTKHGIWLDAPAAQLTCDYNNVYVTGPGTNYYGENGGNQADLTAWQASIPAVGANSTDVDPLFVNPAPDYTPNNPAMNDLGNTTLGVTDDYLNATRSATPDMGAFEFSVAPLDIATTAIVAPDTNDGCYTATDTIIVEITNYGSATVNFTTNPTTVTVQVAGPGGPSTHTAIVNTDSLLSLGTLNVTLTPTVDLTANGVYTFDAYSSTVGDVTLTNDTLGTYTYNVNIVAGTIEASPDVICASGTTDVTLTGNYGANVQWQTSPNGMAPWSNVGAGMSPHTSATLTATTYYRAMLTCNTNADSTNIDTIIVNNPMIDTNTIVSDTVCGADTVTLVASPIDTSNSINWYDAPTGGNLVGTTDSFSTYITGPTTFYAAAVASQAIVDSAMTPPDGTGSFGNRGSWFVAQSDYTITEGFVPRPSLGAFQTIAILKMNTTATPPTGTGYTVLFYTGNNPATGYIPMNVPITAGDVIVVHTGRSTSATATSTTTPYVGSPFTGVTVDGLNTTWNRVTFGAINPTAPTFTASPSGSTSTTAASFEFNVEIGSDCAGTRVPVAAVSTPGPTIVASATDTLVCVGDSTMLMATGAGPSGTYAWDNGGVTGVNFVPPSSPITYTLTGTDSAGCSSVDSVVLVNADPFPGTATASPDIHCLSGSSVLDAISGASIQWQEATSATGPWTNVGTPGTTYTTPTLTSTMYYRALNTCGATTDTSTVDTVIVENPMIASTTGDTICGPNSATLTASFVSGTASTINWFDDALGANLLDTGMTLATPVISATDTFYAAAATGVFASYSLGKPDNTGVGGNYTFLSDGLDFDATSDFTLDSVTVYPNGAGNVVVNIFDATNTLVGTNTVAVTGGGLQRIPVGISVPAGTGYYMDATGTTTGGLFRNSAGAVYPYTAGGVSITNAINNLAGYYYFWFDWKITVSEGCVGPLVPVIAVVNPSGGNLAQATAGNTASNAGVDSNTYMQMDGQTLSYYNNNCELIATIDDGAGGNVLGNTVSTVNVDAVVPTHNGEPFSARWYQITPTSNGPADVTLYFTQADFNAYNAHPSVGSTHDSLPTGPADAAGIARLRITKNDNGGLGVNPVELTPTLVNWNMTDNRWEVTVPVTSFSQFRAHALNPNNTPLPVTLTKFGVTKEGSVSLAAWITASERNNSHFNLQRSLDGNTFTTLGKVNTKAVNGTSLTELNYDFTDVSPQIGHNYYRLEQVDQDGNLSYSKIVDVVWGADGSVVSIYPNPATDKLNVDVSIDKVAQLEVRLLDMSGRVIKSTVQQTVKGMNNVTFDLSDLASGVYGVQIYENNQLTHTGKVNKQVN